MKCHNVNVKLISAAVLTFALMMPATAAAEATSGNSKTIERDGSSVETTVTGKVERIADVISVVLPASVGMSIKTDERGRLDQAATQNVEVDVINESKSTKTVDIELYETIDDEGLLKEVNLHLNGQNINRAIGRSTGEINLIESLSPGETGKLVLSASPVGADRSIQEGARMVKTTVKATAS